MYTECIGDDKVVYEGEGDEDFSITYAGPYAQLLENSGKHFWGDRTTTYFGISYL